jgi:hypothetical protein
LKTIWNEGINTQQNTFFCYSMYFMDNVKIKENESVSHQTGQNYTTTTFGSFSGLEVYYTFTLLHQLYNPQKGLITDV